jgi:pentatricopeptide repeat protein
MVQARHRCVCFPSAAPTSSFADGGRIGSTSPLTRGYSFKALSDDRGFDQEKKESTTRRKGFVRAEPKNRNSTPHRNFGFVDRTQFLEMEKRTVEHINAFPSHGSDSKILSRWHQRTAELVMEWAKLWGKKRASNSVTPQQVSRGVSLSHDLMEKVLDLTKYEVERALEQTDGVVGDSANMPQANKKVLDIEICCETVALGWSRCDIKTIPSLNAAKNAQRILDRLEEIGKMYDSLPKSVAKKLSFTRQDVIPTSRFYNHVLSCWSRSPDLDSGDCARSLLNRMAANRAFSLPDTISYNNLLHVYANKGDVEKAEALLRQMEDPSSVDHSSSPINHQFPQHNEIQPDVFSYSIVLNAMRKRFMIEHNMDDPVRAEKFLTDMVNKGVTPNEVCYSTVLSMYNIADRILRERRDDGRKWRNRGSEANNVGWGAENAVRVLEWLIDLYERQWQSREISNVQLNSQHFTTVIDCISKSTKGVEGARQCELLCDRLISLYKSSGADCLRPRPEVRDDDNVYLSLSLLLY